MKGKIELIDNKPYYIIRYNNSIIDIKRVTFKNGKENNIRLNNNKYNKIMQSLYNNNN